MSWLLFIDESGHDHGASPYEVLAGVAIQDRAVREVIAQLHEAETRWFGRRYSDGRRELKGKVLLSHLADQVARLRYRATRERLGNPEFEIWSFAHITDLRTQAERDGDRI